MGSCIGGRVKVCVSWREQPYEFYCAALGVSAFALGLNALVADGA